MQPNVMLVGTSGSGKTHALRTLIDAGKETFILFTEPGMEVVDDIPCDKGLHYHYVAPARPDLRALDSIFEKINTLSYEALTKLNDPNRRQFTQFRQVLRLVANFKCERCGQEFGDVTEWGEERAFCIDSLTGLNVMAMQLATGLKPVKAMQEWQMAQNALENFLQLLCTGTKCAFVLTAHLEREVDEVTGAHVLMASTLGRKLAPRLPRFFSDVVMAVRKGDKFFWSTTALNVDLKARNLPWASELPPTFEQIFKGGK